MVVELAATLSVAVAVGFGLRGVSTVQVAFAGQPLTVRSTEPLNPFRAVTVSVVLCDVPCPTLNDGGLAAMDISGGWQLENLNEPNAVCQLKLPFDTRYSLVYQNVQSSEGSIRMAV